MGTSIDRKYYVKIGALYKLNLVLMNSANMKYLFVISQKYIYRLINLVVGSKNPFHYTCTLLPEAYDRLGDGSASIH